MLLPPKSSFLTKKVAFLHESKTLIEEQCFKLDEAEQNCRVVKQKKQSTVRCENFE